MIFINPIYLIAAIIILIFILLSFIFLIFCAIFAYRKNIERESDDLEKKDFVRLSPWLTPVTPILWLDRLILLAPWSIPFGVFPMLFPFILFIFRPLPEKSAFKRFVIKIGNSILKINTKMLSAFGLHAKAIQFIA